MLEMHFQHEGESLLHGSIDCLSTDETGSNTSFLAVQRPSIRAGDRSTFFSVKWTLEVTGVTPQHCPRTYALVVDLLYVEHMITMFLNYGYILLHFDDAGVHQ